MEHRIKDNVIIREFKDDMIFELEKSLQHIKTLKEKLELIPETEQETVNWPNISFGKLMTVWE